jgi:hypothetical protein
VEHIGQQLHVPKTALEFYNWTGRTTKRYRVHIRQFLEFREGTVADATEMTAWLSSQLLLDENRQLDRLKEVVYERYRELKIEPPPPASVERIIRSAVRSADARLYAKALEKLAPEIQTRLDTLLGENMSPGNNSLLFDLKSEAGAATLENVLSEIAKLARIRALSLPPDLFAGVSRKRSFNRDLNASRPQNLPFIDTQPKTITCPDLRLVLCLKTASTNQRPYIALFSEF